MVADQFFLLPFLTALLVALVLLTLIVVFTKGKNIDDKRDSSRHIHAKGVSRLGGAAIIVAFLVALILDQKLVIDAPLKWIMIASAFILIFGLVDDIRQLNWKLQLAFQVTLVLGLYLAGIKLEYISNPFGGIYFFQAGAAYYLGMFISIAWIVFLMNAMNWVDGVDGISGMITLIAALVVFALSLKPEVNQPPVGIITAALAGSLVAFLVYNFHPAKIMAGTSGSMFMGFILAVLAIFAGAKIATTMMVLAVPIIDTLWVLGERIYFKKSAFEADQRHLHFRLLKLGWSIRKIFLFYFLLTFSVAALSLKMRATGKIAAMLIFAVFLLAIIFSLAKKSLVKERAQADV